VVGTRTVELFWLVDDAIFVIGEANSSQDPRRRNTKMCVAGGCLLRCKHSLTTRDCDDGVSTGKLRQSSIHTRVIAL
jgi:hypothetical protein